MATALVCWSACVPLTTTRLCARNLRVNQQQSLQALSISPEGLGKPESGLETQTTSDQRQLQNRVDGWGLAACATALRMRRSLIGAQLLYEYLEFGCGLPDAHVSSTET